MGVLCILGSQYTIGTDLSTSLMFRSKFLEQFIFAWIISSMECVAFEHVLDFELERPTSAKTSFVDIFSMQVSNAWSVLK